MKVLPGVAYHPYGLVSYATTYAGNQFFVNMLGYTTKFEAPPVILEDLGKPRTEPAAKEAAAPADAGGVPALGLAAILGAAVVGLAWARRRGA